MPVLSCLCKVNGIACAIQGEWADLRQMRHPPAGLTARIGKAVELYPCELLFVHRDAEGVPYDSRRNEVREAVTTAVFEGIQPPASVCVIPVRMQEAWL